VLVAKVALPEARVPVPRVVEPSVKVTVPVGVVVPEAGVTVAVKVMLVPLTAEVADTETLVVVAMMGGLVMETLTADEVLLLKAVGVVAPP
jgi:hypothetical protein